MNCNGCKMIKISTCLARNFWSNEARLNVQRLTNFSSNVHKTKLPSVEQILVNLNVEHNERLAQYRQLERNSNHNNGQHLAPKNISGLTNTISRSFLFHRNDKPQKQNKRIPKLVLLQNPFRWLMNKFDFSVLRKVWDPSFQEKDFKFGTTQAISRVTHVISEGQYSELNGLLTKPAYLSLMRELDRNWNEKQRSLLALKREDIQISSPLKVYFIRIADKRYCDVDMAFLALKWTPVNNIDTLLFTEIFARFHREYTPHCIPEWTIAYFKVVRFEIVRR